MAQVSSELAGVRELAAHEQAHRNNLEARIKELEVCACVYVCGGRKGKKGGVHVCPGSVWCIVATLPLLCNACTHACSTSLVHLFWHPLH